MTPAVIIPPTTCPGLRNAFAVGKKEREGAIFWFDIYSGLSPTVMAGFVAVLNETSAIISVLADTQTKISKIIYLTPQYSET